MNGLQTVLFGNLILSKLYYMNGQSGFGTLFLILAVLALIPLMLSLFRSN